MLSVWSSIVTSEKKSLGLLEKFYFGFKPWSYSKQNKYEKYSVLQILFNYP